jgi:hypothetical protein
MSKSALRIVIGLLGLVPISIGATGMFSGLEGLIPGAPIDARADGQYRYLAAIYLGFGCLLLWIQSRLEQEFDLFRILMAMVFIAGVGRLTAIVVHGLPEFPVALATAFELIAPPLFVLWHGKVVTRPDNSV